MSIKIMNLVWNSDSTALPGPGQRFVLLALADRADDDGHVAALGVPNIVRKTGLKRTATFGHLRELECNEWIKRVDRRRANGSRSASGFWINVAALIAHQVAGTDDRDAGLPANPFDVSPAQPPVRNPDGGGPESGRGGSGIRTGGVRNPDGQGVRNPDGGGPESGPLDPYSETETPSVRNAGAPGGSSPAADGRTVDPSEEQRRTGIEIASRLPLAKVDAKPRQRSQVALALAVLLAVGHSVVAVERHARSKLNEARTVRYLLAGLAPEMLMDEAAGSATIAPEWCGTCDEGARTRLVITDDDPYGEVRRCQTCHPGAQRAKRASGPSRDLEDFLGGIGDLPN